MGESPRPAPGERGGAHTPPLRSNPKATAAAARLSAGRIYTGLSYCTVRAHGSYTGLLRLVNTNQIYLPSELQHTLGLTFALYVNEHGAPDPPVYTADGYFFAWVHYGASAPEWYLMKQHDEQLMVVAQTVGGGAVWLEDATAIALPGGQVIIPGLLLFGVEPPPPPPPPLSAAEQALARQQEKQAEHEAKFNEMLTELSNTTSEQMAGMQQQIVMLGKVAGKKMLDMAGEFEGKLSETAATVISTQDQVLQLGHSQASDGGGARGS